MTGNLLDPELSIVIATTQPWPEVRLVLDSVYDQAQDAGAEILVADGNGNGAVATPHYDHP